MKFGSYAVLDEATHHFEKEPKWFWKIKPATSKDKLTMARFMVINRVITTPDGVRREIPPTWLEVAYREIALTFAGTNIPADEAKPVEDGGDPILKADATTEQIETVLQSMPQAIVNELWKAVGEANPTWGPGKPQKAQTEASSLPS